jgi:hypothetical protein
MATAKIVISKQTKKGQQLEISVTPGTVIITLDGKLYYQGSNTGHPAMVRDVGMMHIFSAVKPVAVTLEEGEAVVAAYEQAIKDALPGLDELQNTYHAWASAQEKYHQQRERAMEDEQNDGTSWPTRPSDNLKNEYQALVEKYPRAALYLRAERQRNSTHWADNTGKGAAGAKAMQLLLDGASLEEAEAALAERRQVYVD